VRGQGGDEPFPPFFIGLFSFLKMDGSLRRHSTFFGGGFPPLRMKTAAAMLALIIQFLTSHIPNQINHRDNDSSS